jgi:hypothetical protein
MLISFVIILQVVRVVFYFSRYIHFCMPILMKGKYRKRKEKKKARFFCTRFLTNNLSSGNADVFSNDGTPEEKSGQTPQYF